MGFDLLLAMTIAYFLTKNTVQDLAWKARGQDPPSFRREQARWERRQARAAQRGDDGPGRQFWRNVWSDAVASAEERRERIAARAAKRRRAKWAQADLDAAEDEAREINERIEPDETAERFRPYDQRNQDERSRPVDPGDPPGSGAGDDPPADYVDPPRSDEHHEPPVEAPGGTVTDLNAWRVRGATPPITKEDMMSGETTNLSAALRYAEDMASQCGAGAASTETSIATMKSGGVGGAVITHFTHAQDLLTQAMAAFNSGLAELQADIAVKDAYQARQDAGDKQFVTQD